MTTDTALRDEPPLTMKDLAKQYRTVLPARSCAVIRVDGKGFSNYTKGLPPVTSFAGPGVVLILIFVGIAAAINR
ncbi:hypothetical protein ACQCSU_01760 [Pseudarthrobacter sp. O4]|uniref:hypothetical protein n=1 Tax=Pseudarthrobacter sp. O4 TaxID=3418417 RepID=UPI003CE7E862